jgi:hypothetical protein
MHEALGGAFPNRHHVNCGVIAIIRKMPILGRHTSVLQEEAFVLLLVVMLSNRLQIQYAGMFTDHNTLSQQQIISLRIPSTRRLPPCWRPSSIIGALINKKYSMLLGTSISKQIILLS